MRIILSFVAALLLPIAALGQNYSATFKGNSLRSTLEVLTKATGYDFVYKTGLVGQIDRTVTGEYTDVPLEQLLDLTLTDQLGLSYKIVDKTISLFEDNSHANTAASTITGTVTDKAGDPLPGVTVLLKGNPRHGTSTDIDGRYTLTLPRGTKNPVLVFSFVGMEPKELSTRGRSSMNVTLDESPETLHDVVVTGIFRRNKELATGASTTFSAK